jgi:hypothetical protein
MGNGIGGSSDPYKSDVIDTIVEQVQGRVGDDRAVVMLGYKKEMEALMKAANPGLARRFQLENAFQFEDYNEVELNFILNRAIKYKGLTSSVKTRRDAINKLEKVRSQPNFGNGGSVMNMLSEAIKNMSGRYCSNSTLLPEDFVNASEKAEESSESLFSRLVGVEKVKETLKRMKVLFFNIFIVMQYVSSLVNIFLMKFM